MIFHRQHVRGGHHPTWSDDLETARAQARREDKPLLVYFTADWCGYCREAKRFFQNNGVEFHDRDLDIPGVRSEAADLVQERTGSRSVSTPTRSRRRRASPMISARIPSTSSSW